MELWHIGLRSRIAALSLGEQLVDTPIGQKLAARLQPGHVDRLSPALQPRIKGSA